MISSLIGAGTALISGAMTRESQREVNNIAQQQYNQNIQLQKEFAQNGLRWRVADAKAAGIHPVAALGFQGSTYTPQATVSYGAEDYSDIASAGGYLSQGLGQAIDRAKEAGQSHAERAIQELRAEQQYQYTNRMQSLQLQNQELQNQALAVEIAQMAGASRRAVVQTALPPAFPDEIDSSALGQQDSLSVGHINKWAELVDPDGKVVGLTPDPEWAESLESAGLIGSAVIARELFGSLDGEIAGYYEQPDGTWVYGRKPQPFLSKFVNEIGQAIDFYKGFGRSYYYDD